MKDLYPEKVVLNVYNLPGSIKGYLEEAKNNNMFCPLKRSKEIVEFFFLTVWL